MNITLINDDCSNVLQKLVNDGINVDAIITDPPYDTKYDDMPTFGQVTFGNIIYFCDPRNRLLKYPDEILFWVKTPSTKNYSKNCGRFVEEILVNRRKDAPFNPLHWSQMTGVFDDRLIYPPIHPNEKPLTLIERLVRIYTNPGDLVFDPYMGSGTTALACKNTGRRFIGCEINYEYFKVAELRVSQE